MKNTNTHLRVWSVLLACIVPAVLLMLVSCGSSTKSESGVSISGQVVLEESSRTASYDSIYVAAYQTVSLDSDLSSAVGLFPSGTFDFDAATLFDYRAHTPKATVLADASGSFKLSGLSKGYYHVVVFKRGYGFSILHTVSAYQNTDAGTVNLYEETHYGTTTLDGNITFAGGHHYVINGNLYTSESSSVTIEPGAWIRINPSGSLQLFGQVNAAGTAQDYFHICSNDGYQSFPPASDTIEPYQNVRLGTSCTISALSHGIIQGGDAFFVDTALEASHMFFCEGSNGIVGTGATLNSTVFADYDATALFLGEDSEITDCIFLRNNIAFHTYDVTITVANNCFDSNNMGIYAGDCYLYIENNEFDDNEYGVVLSGADANIELNVLRNNTVGLEFSRLYTVEPYYTRCNPVIFHNNFYLGSGELYVDNAGTHDMNWGPCAPGAGVTGPVPATYNYWDKSDIDTYLNDDNEYPPAFNVYEVVYTPSLSSPMNSAGIQ